MIARRPTAAAAALERALSIIPIGIFTGCAYASLQCVTLDFRDTARPAMTTICNEFGRLLGVLLTHGSSLAQTSTGLNGRR